MLKGLNTLKSQFIILLLILLPPLYSQNISKLNTWQKVQQGLFIAEFETIPKSEFGDSKITVIKINPQYYTFKLVSASENDNEGGSAKGWGEQFNLIAAINAGMYQQDYITNVGFMKNFDHFNNSGLRKDYNSILVFNPIDKSVPEIQIIDKRCQDFESLKNKYKTLIQNIRMIDCKQKNVWQQQPKKWSTAALAIDKQGNVLFIHCRSPYSVHDFINILLKLPLNINNAMYLEGGPEASLYFNAGGIEFEKFGSYETGFNENDNNNFAWKIPNVIVVIKKD